MENKADFFNIPRGEKEMFEGADLDLDLTLPLTREGFEALIVRACGIYQLPVDDSVRSVLAGWIHHIPNSEHTTTIKKIAGILYKSISNALTYTIDQEIKAKNRATKAEQDLKFATEMAEKQKLVKLEKAELKRQRKGLKLAGSPESSANETSTQQ